MTSVFFAEDPQPVSRPNEGLVVELDSFEGPLDLLLQLARDQKVDLTKISILALAEQYLDYVRTAQRLRLELAADYLVMAAWLAFLKSKLLLPEPQDEEEELSGAEMAAVLRFHLQRLQAMQDKGAELLRRPQLDSERFARGRPEELPELAQVRYEAGLYDLLAAYGRVMSRQQARPSLRILRWNLHSVEEAVQRLTRLLHKRSGWQDLSSFLPADAGEGLERRSAVASTLVAGLELCRDGRAEIAQDRSFGPVRLRARRTLKPAEMKT